MCLHWIKLHHDRIQWLNFINTSYASLFLKGLGFLHQISDYLLLKNILNQASYFRKKMHREMVSLYGMCATYQRGVPSHLPNSPLNTRNGQ